MNSRLATRPSRILGFVLSAVLPAGACFFAYLVWVFLSLALAGGGVLAVALGVSIPVAIVVLGLYLLED